MGDRARRLAVLAAALAGLGAACAAVREPSAAPVASKDPEPGLMPPPVPVDEYLRLDRAAAGYRRPRPSDDGCLKRALRAQPALAGVANTVKFAVLRDGSLRGFVYLNPEPPELAAAIETAFRSCSWEPGLDPSGHPIAVWVIQPIKVAPAPAP